MSKCLAICHLNARSIFAYNSSLKLAESSAVSNFSDFLCVRHYLCYRNMASSSVSNNPRLPGFCSPFRLDRNRHGGGVLSYVKCNIFCQRRLDLECAGTENCSSNVELQKASLVFSSALMLSQLHVTLAETNITECTCSRTNQNYPNSNHIIPMKYKN